MDIEALVDALNKTFKEISAREFSLGKLIESLKNLNYSLMVEIDDGTFPMKSELEYAEEGDEQKEYGFEYEKNTNSVFNSWRGSYCELSMEYSKESQNITVKELLDMAEFVNGKILRGYKGGDFLMDLETPIHIDNYGVSGGPKLIGVREGNGKAILITRWESDE